MSFDIPPEIEPQVQEFARSQHISANEAVLRLIEAGLGMNQIKHPNRAILGAFSSPEEREAMDGAMELAMRDRERRNARPDGHA